MTPTTLALAVSEATGPVPLHQAISHLKTLREAQCPEDLPRLNAAIAALEVLGQSCAGQLPVDPASGPATRVLP